MGNIPLKSKIEEPILNFIDRLTAPNINDYDIGMFYDLLNGKKDFREKTLFKLRIGSRRRINKKIFDEPMPLLFYNEFNVQIRLTSKSLHLMATLFHNENNRTEGFSYNVDQNLNSGIAEETWILTNQDDDQVEGAIEGRKPELFFEDICDLLRMNRDIGTYSELEPSYEVIKIRKEFDELMLTTSDDWIDWALSNELETDEKIRVLQNLSVERKLQIINNLRNEK